MPIEGLKRVIANLRKDTNDHVRIIIDELRAGNRESAKEWLGELKRLIGFWMAEHKTRAASRPIIDDFTATTKQIEERRRRHKEWVEAADARIALLTKAIRRAEKLF